MLSCWYRSFGWRLTIPVTTRPRRRNGNSTLLRLRKKDDTPESQSEIYEIFKVREIENTEIAEVGLRLQGCYDVSRLGEPTKHWNVRTCSAVWNPTFQTELQAVLHLAVSAVEETSL